MKHNLNNQFRPHVFLSTEMEELSKHGIILPPNMQGLTEEQIADLRLKDEWEDKCVPSGGYTETNDPMGRRNGRGTVWC